MLTFVDACDLPTPWATFRLHGFQHADSGKEHVALTLGDVGGDEPVLARIHSECLTGDGLFSQRCDCGPQLQAAMEAVAREGRGIILYLRQEGRGIGLLNKIRAYRLQDEGADTVEANEQLGFPPDLRAYDLAAAMLCHFGICRVRLMTNNPAKLDAMAAHGVEISERLPLLAGANARNRGYLDTKASKMGHWLPSGDDPA